MTDFKKGRSMVYHTLKSAQYIADQIGMQDISNDIDSIIKEIHAESKKENKAHLEKIIPGDNQRRGIRK